MPIYAYWLVVPRGGDKNSLRSFANPHSFGISFFVDVNASKHPPTTYRHFQAALQEVSVASRYASPNFPADIHRQILSVIVSYSVDPTRVTAMSRAMSTNDLSVVDTSSAEQNCALVSWSGGKDSCLAYFRAKNEGTSCRTL